EKALIKDKRAELVIHNLSIYRQPHKKIKALAFCATKSHAQYMNRKFNELGYSSLCLLGESTDKERKEACEKLQSDREDLQIICSVDIFGEGVDIPGITHILLLRPTQSFSLFLQQIGRGLRKTEDKEIVYILDFVGNFKNSYVAPLALKGLYSLEEMKFKKETLSNLTFSPPPKCFINIHAKVKQIWKQELSRILLPTNKKELLLHYYKEFRCQLDPKDSLQMMDFFANPVAPHPQIFIQGTGFSNWLRAKKYFKERLEKEMPDMVHLSDYEESLLDTPGEAFLTHIEKELHPTKSYKMAVLRCLLKYPLSETSWNIHHLAKDFLSFYLQNPSLIQDWDGLAKFPDPKNLPLSKVKEKLKRYPLFYLSNKQDSFFLLDKKENLFWLKEEIHPYWQNPEFRTLVIDRVHYCLAKYCQKKGFILLKF
ncbi:MAG: restriction endonuclease subunit R, partial [Planctomycetota bacterium]